MTVSVFTASDAEAGLPCLCPLCAAAAFAEQAAQAGDFVFDSLPHDADQGVDALLSGHVWATSALTYSFPDSAADYSYRGELSVQDTFSEATAALADAARQAFASYASVSGLTFTELVGDADRNADIAVARSAAPDTAFAYFPNDADEGGDAWFNDTDYNNPVAGTYAWATVLHEIGHGLGLKHGHEAAVAGAATGAGAAPHDLDSHEYTVMTYRSYVGSEGVSYTNAHDGGPQTLMMLDIAAIQRMYGANFDDRAGDNVYSFVAASGRMRVDGALQEPVAGNVIFRTIWDGGGDDTYDFSAYSRRLSIDLSPGGHVDLDVDGNAQRAELGDGAYARGHVFNALEYEGDARSLIENAIGGAAADLILGNRVGNRLEGGGGADTLSGLAGDDTLTGGAGADRFVFTGGGDDLALDLDFAAGDVAEISGFAAGTFSDAFFAEAGLDVLADGGGVLLDDAADLEAAAQADEIDLVDAGGLAALEFAGGRVVFATLDFVRFAPVAISVDAAPDLDDPLSSPEIGGGVSAPDVVAPDVAVVTGVASTDSAESGRRMFGAATADRMAGSSGDDSMAGRAGDDRLAGRAGDDLLRGQNGQDRLFGGADDDRLFGGAAQDRLFGGAGADTLKGGAGADRLVGGVGADEMHGGAGRDVFVFAGRAGRDAILGFQDGQDRLAFRDAGGLDDLTIVRAGDDALIRHEGGVVRLAGVDPDDLSAADFLFG